MKTKKTIPSRVRGAARAARWAVVWLALVPACSRSGHRNPGASVVLVSIDTLRADLLGCYGQARPTSPNLDAFAKESILFRRAISQAGWTSPSHMTMLTSLYPTVHKVSNFDLGLGAARDEAGREIARRRLDPTVPTLASALKRAGYRTAAFVGGGNLNRESGFDQGFETFDDTRANGMNGNRESLFDPATVLAWIQDHRNEKFFLFLHTYIPHAPYLPPSPWNTAFDPDYSGRIPSDREAFYRAPAATYREREQRFWGVVDPKDPRDVEHLKALYAGDVRYADDAMARLLDGMRQSGILDHSLVAVVSDHGEEFLEHGDFQHPGELYEELVHVPFLLHLPAAASREGRVVDETVRLLDLMPTLLDLVDVPIPREAQGRSLLPILEGSARGGKPEPAVSETVNRWEKRKAGDGEIWTPADFVRTVRDGGFTYLQRVVSRRISREELFDLNADPRETQNLAAAPGQADRIARFREFCQAHARDCERLAARFEKNEWVVLLPEHVDDLEALGYVK